MRAWKRVVLVLGGLLLTVLVGIVLFLTFADLSRFRPRVESALTSALGRETRIAGEFGLKVLPTPSIVAEQVTIANAPWGTAGPMLSIGRLTGKVSLWSLVSGPIRIEALEADDVTVLFEDNEAGESNWRMTKEEPPETPAEPSVGLPLSIVQAAITKGKVVLKRLGAEDSTLVLAKLDLHTDHKDVMNVAVSGQLGEVPFNLTGTAGTQQALAAGTDVDVHLKADLDAVGVTVDGTLTDNLRGARLSLQASSEDVARLLRLFKVSTEVSGALETKAELIVTADRYELRDLTLKLPAAEARIHAVVSKDFKTPATVEIQVTAPNLADLGAKWPKMPLKATAKGNVSAKRIEFDPLTIELGESDFAGSLFMLLDKRSTLVVRGKSKLVELTPFSKAAAPPDANTTAKDAATAKPKPGKWVFGEEPLALKGLSKASLDVKLDVDELGFADTRLRTLVLAMRVDQGKAEVTTTFSTPNGGSAKGSAALVIVGDGADLSIDFDARDFPLNIASGEIDNPAKIPPVGISVNLRSSGGSLRALASAAHGRVWFTQGVGQIKNKAVGLASGGLLSQLFSALNPFAKKEEYSHWQCTVVALQFKEGVGKLKPMLAQSDKLVIVGGGKVDLKNEKLAIVFNTKPRTGIGITADMFVTPFVKLSGTLAAPRIGLNESGTLLSGGAAVLTGGISFLVQGFLDRATAEGDQCGKALAAIDEKR